MFDSDLQDAMEVLKREQERRQIMSIIGTIRSMGGEDIILKLAGCILMSPKQSVKEGA